MNLQHIVTFYFVADITAREIAGLMGMDTEEFRASRDRFSKAEVMITAREEDHRVVEQE